MHFNLNCQEKIQIFHILTLLNDATVTAALFKSRKQKQNKKTATTKKQLQNIIFTVFFFFFHTEQDCKFEDTESTASVNDFHICALLFNIHLAWWQKKIKKTFTPLLASFFLLDKERVLEVETTVGSGFNGFRFCCWPSVHVCLRDIPYGNKILKRKTNKPFVIISIGNSYSEENYCMFASPGRGKKSCCITMDIYLWYSYRAFSILLQKSEEIFVLQEKYICPLS